ncbi:hypothetical protein CHX26_06330 [Porphyrobacter sp. HT-58-2]|nr:hypothetical protein CHX26_06330 [Porphyrobacter sp. HT-58-2]
MKGLCVVQAGFIQLNLNPGDVQTLPRVILLAFEGSKITQLVQFIQTDCEGLTAAHYDQAAMLVTRAWQYQGDLTSGRNRSSKTLRWI